jgi:hypothetical protein
VALQIVNPFAVAAVRRIVRDFKPDAALVNHFAFHLSPAVLSALHPVPTVLSTMDYKAVCPIGSKLLPDGTICHQPAGLVCWRGGCVSLPHWLRDQPRYALIRRRSQSACRAPAPGCRKSLAERHRKSIPIPVNAPREFVRARRNIPRSVRRTMAGEGVDVLFAHSSV